MEKNESYGNEVDKDEDFSMSPEERKVKKEIIIIFRPNFKLNFLIVVKKEMKII